MSVKYAFVINKNGYVIDSEFITKEQEKEEKYITLPFPIENLLYIPRWNGVEWVEGETEEDRNKREYNEYVASLIPSNSEIEEARIEIKSIKLLQDMGVV